MGDTGRVGRRRRRVDSVRAVNQRGTGVARSERTTILHSSVSVLQRGACE